MDANNNAGRRVLATDLDGTLIPLDGSAQNAADLRTLQEELSQSGIPLVYVTGRHLESIEGAIAEYGLPSPDWVIADVGTSLYRPADGTGFDQVSAFREHLTEITAALPTSVLRERLADFSALRLQEEEKQGRFKLSYYTDAAHLESTKRELQRRLDASSAPYWIIASVDPFNGDGLIDLLWIGFSKAYALKWWVNHAGFANEDVVFCGDSGNDLTALTSGYHAVVVGNADRGVARDAYDAHREAGWRNRLYLAKQSATSGVLEGCRWFGLLDSTTEPPDRLGATPISSDSTAFRVWAPVHWQVAVEIDRERRELQRDGEGYYAGVVTNCPPGSLYKFVPGEGGAYPDPASAFQPEGVHGPSAVVDPRAFAWTDQAWQGVAKRDLVIYELHIGALTAEGTYQAAIAELPRLVELGVTAIELLPVAQTPGRWNWGYDGVGLFAPNHNYGEPDDLKALVDAAHAAGLAVLLDVVYNHLGPEGNYLGQFGPYTSPKHHTPWGDALNYDDKRSEGARRLVVENAVRWLEEFHMDGLRLDAVHFMFDDSRPTVLDEMRAAVDKFAKVSGRTVHLIGETNAHTPELLCPSQSPPVFDALWSDCLMHTIYSLAAPGVRLVDRPYNGVTDLVAALRHGFVYRGAEFTRTADADLGRYARDASGRPFLESFVTALQTHDSVGNHPRGARIHQLTSKSFQKAAAALTLLHPSLPLLLMGEEHASDSPFPFFADFHDKRLRRAVDKGRAREYPSDLNDRPLRPSAEATFLMAKPRPGEERDEEMLAWYRGLLALRKQGLAEGWLTATSLTAGFDDQLDAVWVRYGHALTIHARLRLEGAPTPLRTGGEVLMSSEPAEPAANGGLALGPAHAVILRG